VFKIEIISKVVRTKQVTAKVGGKQYTFHEQEAFAFIPDADGVVGKYPTPLKLSHDEPKEAYGPGFYMVAPSSFYVDGYGTLTLGRVKLVPIPVSAAKAS